MAVWKVERFERVEKRIMDVVTKKRQLIDVPYFRFLYNPELELRCIFECIALNERFKAKKISSEIISFAKLILASLDQLGCLSTEFLRREKEQKDMILDDLQREIPKLIVERLCDHLKDKDMSHCAILIRAGALFPFVHISKILSSIEGNVKCTLVIPYPGNKEGEMLNYRGETIKSYYRGEIID